MVQFSDPDIKKVNYWYLGSRKLYEEMIFHVQMLRGFLLKQLSYIKMETLMSKNPKIPVSMPAYMTNLF